MICHPSVKVYLPEFFLCSFSRLSKKRILLLEIRCTEPILAPHSLLSVTGNDRMYGRTLIRTSESIQNSAQTYRYCTSFA